MDERKKLSILFFFATFFLTCGRTGIIEVVEGFRMNTQIVDDDPRGDVGYYADFQIDKNNIPLISYYDRLNGDLRFAELNKNTGNWEVNIVDREGDVGRFTNLILDTEGDPLILYLDSTNRRLKIARFKRYAWRIGTLPELPDYTPFGYIKAIRSPEGFLHITLVAVHTTGKYDLVYILYNPDTKQFTGGMVAEGIRNPDIPEYIPSSLSLFFLVREEKPIPAIAFYDQPLFSLRLAKSSTPFGGGWEISPPLAGGGYIGEWQCNLLGNTRRCRFLSGEDAGQYVGAVAESPTVIHFSYFNQTNKWVEYLRWDLTTEERLIEVVDKEGIVGNDLHIFLDGRNRPTLVYYDSTNNDLKMAVRFGPNRWLTFRPDLRGVVGSNPVGKLLPDGQVGITYRDISRKALKFTIVRSD